MTHRTTLLRLALSGAFALSAAASAAGQSAGSGGKEQCAGIVKAGQNDCATSTNDCHSHATVDSSPEAWIYVPKGTCDKIVGGHVVHVKEPPPKK
jgi:uncharacterized membrane protein